MNPLDIFKKEEPEIDPFTANRNKKIAATVLMPSADEIKQKEAEQGI